MQKLLLIVCAIQSYISQAHAFHSRTQSEDRPHQFDISASQDLLAYPLLRATSYNLYESTANSHKRKFTAITNLVNVKKLREAFDKIRRFQEYQNTRLRRAADLDDEEFIETLLTAYGAQINAQDADGLTALHIAAREGNEAAVKKLLQFKALGTICDNEGLTPLMHAMMQNHVMLVILLMASGGEIRSNNSGFMQKINDQARYNLACEDLDTTSDED